MIDFGPWNSFAGIRNINKDFAFITAQNFDGNRACIPHGINGILCIDFQLPIQKAVHEHWQQYSLTSVNTSIFTLEETRGRR